MRLSGFSVIISGLLVLGSPVSLGAVTFLTGNGSGRISAPTTGLNDANAAASGTFSTSAGSGSAGVSFDFSFTTINGGSAPQTTGLGVNGGTAASGIDNNDGAGPQEAIILNISNFSGLAAGESLVITEVLTSFGANEASETYTINGGSDLVFTTSPETINVPDATSVTIGAGSTGNTRFVISSFTVAVVPEPSAMLLGALGSLLLLRRRR